jgi:small GTP-binding protein
VRTFSLRHRAISDHATISPQIFRTSTIAAFIQKAIASIISHSKSPMLIEEAKLTFRTVTIGDSSVGKTSIVNKFIRDRFDSSEKNTVGALYDAFTEEIDGRAVEIQIWDTAGQEQYRSLTPVYFRSAAAALLVFDLSNRPSFEHLDDWVTSFRSSSSDRAILFLVGNKSDLAENRMISEEEAKEWADNHSCSYTETSARSGSGIAQLFKAVAATLAGNHLHEIEARVVRPKSASERGNEGCC